MGPLPSYFVRAPTGEGTQIKYSLDITFPTILICSNSMHSLEKLDFYPGDFVNQTMVEGKMI